MKYFKQNIDATVYVTLTLYQQQHPDDVLLLPTGKQSHLSTGPVEEDGGK